MVVGGLCGACSCALAQSTPQWAGFEPNVVAKVFALWDEDGPGPGRPRLLTSDVNLPLAPNSAQGRIALYDARAFRSIGVPFKGAYGVRHFYEIEVTTSSGVGSPQPGIYVAGHFDEAGGAPADGLAYWDGTRWSDFTGGLSARIAYSLHMFDEDGEGPDEPNLFIGAGFREIAGVSLPGLVRWDGWSFSIVGGGYESDRCEKIVLSEER